MDGLTDFFIASTRPNAHIPLPPRPPFSGRYLRALTAIETRFPISSDKTTVRVSFPWYDAFR